MSAFSTLVTILCVFSKIDWAFSQNYEALAVITNASTPSGLDLPYSATEENGQITYLEKTKHGEKIEYAFLCPPQTRELVQNLKNASTEFPELAFCLEENLSNKQPIKCSEEVKPVLNLRRDQEGSEKQCGKSVKAVIYDFGFSIVKLKNDAGPSIFKPYPTRDLKMLSLYEVCFNSSNSQTLWTKHRLATVSMLQEPGLPSQKMQPPYEFNKEHYGLHKSTFLKIAEEYKTHQELNPIYKMVPQMMVPEEDLALEIWKKAAIHLANTAELWIYLVPLMKAINDGIRKAVIATSVNTDESNLNESDTTYIYTIVNSYNYRLYLEDLVDSNKHLSKNQFGLNVWCKFIHNETKKTGVMIYLHNLPNTPPIQNDSVDDSKPKMAECDKLIPCAFREWADESEGLSDDLVNYAYCCEVNNKTVKEFFNIELSDELGVFDINSIINKK